MTVLDVDVRHYIGQAANAPAATLIVPMQDLSERSIEDVLKPVRSAAMLLDPTLGAKTMGLQLDGNGLSLHFLQGLPDGSIDRSVRECLNSAAVAAAVARHALQELPDGVVPVRIAGQTWLLEEAAA